MLSKSFPTNILVDNCKNILAITNGVKTSNTYITCCNKKDADKVLNFLSSTFPKYFNENNLRIKEYPNVFNIKKNVFCVIVK